MKKISMVFLLVCFLLTSGCAPIVNVNEQGMQQSRTIAAYDKEHYPVLLSGYNSHNEKQLYTYSKPPQRVVAVWQDTIELLMALGVGDRIIAGMGVPDKKYIRTEYQAAYEKIPYTSLENLDVETITMLEPDFIIGWYSTFGSKVLRGTDFWQSRGVNTYIAPSSRASAHQNKLEEEYEYILDVGKIFDKNARAEDLVRQMQQEIAFVTAKTAQMTQRPRAIVMEFSGKDIRIYGERTLAGNIITELGGDLIARNDTLSLEQVVDLDPDAIFLVITERNYGNEQVFLDRIYHNAALSHLRCIRDKRLYPVPLCAVYSAGIRTYDGIKIMAQGLYPELYKE